MPNLFQIYFYIFAAILIYFSLRSFRGGIEYLRFFQEQLAKPHTEYAPFATVIAPCKGHDEGLLENLSALAEQEYPNYEIIFVVDDPNDIAVRAIEKIISPHAETKVVIA